MCNGLHSEIRTHSSSLRERPSSGLRDNRKYRWNDTTTLPIFLPLAGIGTAYRVPDRHPSLCAFGMSHT
ncbi:unnamed protein product [Colias eurytheme]|nr:unnamed protein product [Colias eurytheme]